MIKIAKVAGLSLLVGCIFTANAMAAKFTVEKDELGSGDTMLLEIPATNRGASLLVKCSSGKQIHTILSAPRTTFFPDDVDFDRGRMDVQVVYKFDSDADATSESWFAPLSNYRLVYSFDRSIAERIGTAGKLVMSVSKGSIRFDIPLSGTKGPIERMLASCT